MPFPDVNRAPTAANSCRTPNEDERRLLFQRISALAHTFGLESRVPLRSAAVAYLGLCRMKKANDSGENVEMSRMCYEALESMKPETSGFTVNCAYFCGDRGKFRDHTRIIDNAMGVYLPTVRSRKKRGLVLMMIGSRHDSSISVPSDDSWIENYLFH